MNLGIMLKNFTKILQGAKYSRKSSIQQRITPKDQCATIKKRVLNNIF